MRRPTALLLLLAAACGRGPAAAPTAAPVSARAPTASSAAPPSATPPPPPPSPSATPLVVVLDHSGSMSYSVGPSGAPTRLALAEGALRAWLTRRAHGKVGVVVFGATAAWLSRPTEDLAALERLVGAIPRDAVDRQGTAFGDAIALAVAPASEAARVVLLTDGDREAAQGLDDGRASERAKARGVPICVVQIGDVDDVQVEAGVDLFNRPVLTHVKGHRDRALMERFARETGGGYRVVTSEDEAVDALEACAP